MSGLDSGWVGWQTAGQCEVAGWPQALAREELTQVDDISFEVEILQHHDDLAALGGGLRPAIHLTPFNVIPARGN